MQSINDDVKTVYYCTYSRNANEPFRLSRPFTCPTDAQMEACQLQAAGYRGVIMQTFEPLYNEANNSFHDFAVVDQF